MEREVDGTVFRKSCLPVSVHYLDVYILVEGPGQPIAGCRENPPAAPLLGQVAYRTVLRRIAQPEKREHLERTVQKDRLACHPSRDCGEMHTYRIGHGDRSGSADLAAGTIRE